MTSPQKGQVCFTRVAWSGTKSWLQLVHRRFRFFPAAGFRFRAMVVNPPGYILIECYSIASGLDLAMALVGGKMAQ
jgi:hypothetical protein